MEIQVVPIEQLFEDPANVRRHPTRNLDAIKASLARFGQQKPIVVDKNMVVRAGNGTLAAARAMGWKDLRVVKTDLGAAEATAFAIADNRTAELAEWDVEALRETMASLEVGPEHIGFTADELSRIIGEAEGEPLNPVGHRLGPVENFENASIKQVVLYFEGPEYDAVLVRLRKIMDERGMASHTDVFLLLLEEFEKAQATAGDVADGADDGDHAAA